MSPVPIRALTSKVWRESSSAYVQTHHGKPQSPQSSVLVVISPKVNLDGTGATITIAAQEPTLLPHRLARSAKDLVRASLSGVACELKDPRMAKQAGSSSQTTAHPQSEGSQSDGAPRLRPALYARETSFRDQPNTSASRAVEQDFVRFQEKVHLDPTQWLSPNLTTYTLDSGTHQEGSHGIQNERHTSHYLTSQANAKDGANDAINAKLSRSNISDMNDSKRDSKADHARAAAARRLEQIGAQIQRDLAMQMSHEDARSVQDYLMATTTIDIQCESTQQPTNQQSTLPQSSHEPHRTFHQHHHQTPTINQVPASASGNPEDEDTQIHFHCPYYACHQNLQRLFSSSSDKMLCVHTGCNEQLETQNAWTLHIALPHHNLQG